MLMQKTLTGFAAVALAGSGIWAFGLLDSSAGPDRDRGGPPRPEKKAAPVIAKPLVAQAARQERKPDPNRPAAGFMDEAISVPDCRLNVIDKTEIPAQREGVLLFIGRRIKDGENVPPDRLDTYVTKEKTIVKEKSPEKDKTTKKEKLMEKEKLVSTDKEVPYYKLKEGDYVDVNDMLALVDDRLAVDERSIKERKLDAAKADLAVSEKTRDETWQRWQTQLRLDRTAATNKEDVRAAELTYYKYVYEVVSKNAAIEVARSELQQTQTVVEYHEIRNKIPGRIQTIYKKKGEAVKNLEPVMLIRNLNRLRAEGMVDVQYLPRLRKGTRVLIEPSIKSAHYEPFVGHTQAITGVAVSKDPDNPLIVSSSEDGTVRVWRPRPDQRTEYRIYYHRVGSTPIGVRSVACAPPGGAANWCLSGANDGSLRLWDLDADRKDPVLEFDRDHKHRGPVNCLAFNHDGTLCASGGDDREIRVWETATGQLKARLTDHHGPIESLQFTPDGQLVSAAKDRTIMVWNLGDDPHKVGEFPRRSGDVPVLGVSPDGKRVLYDPWQSKELRVLSLDEGRTMGVIRNPSGTAGFKTLALFSADGKLVLTGTGTEGKLQLWNAPTETDRAHEIRELATSERFRSPVTCAAFSPNAGKTSFVAAGTKDRQVLVWPLPSQKDIDESQIPGEVSYIEESLDASAHQVRIWADFQNPKDPKNKDPKNPERTLLMPSDIVTVVVPPTLSP